MRQYNGPDGIPLLRVTDHLVLCGLQRAGDGGGAPLRHVLAQPLLHVPMELLKEESGSGLPNFRNGVEVWNLRFFTEEDRFCREFLDQAQGSGTCASLKSLTNNTS